MDLPMGLVNAIESGNCVLFLGAGIGNHASDRNGDGAPDAATLAKRLAHRFGVDTDTFDLPKVAQIVELRRGREQLLAFVKRELDELEPDENLLWLLSLTWKAIYTTNYDAIIERCYELNPDPMQVPVIIATNSEAKDFDPLFEVPVFHLHGSLFTEGGRGAILITEQDYARYRERRSMLFDHFRYQYATTPILYVGYSHNDSNWQAVTAEVRVEFATASPPPSFRLTPTTTALDRELLEGQGITTLDGDLSQLRTAVSATLGPIRVEPHQLAAALENSVPADLRGLLDQHAPAVSRLLRQWYYVNQEDFAGQPNVADFLKGSTPNWALVGQGRNFRRDLEEPLVDDLLDYATSPSSAGVRTRIVLGPAGYGMTTLLMATAAWSARERAASVLFLRPGSAPNLSDVEFAVTTLPMRVVLVVDNASDHAGALAVIVSRLRAIGAEAFILMGDRLNEWRQARTGLIAREIALEPLSDGEIDILLQMLERENALGHLAGLSDELRFRGIKVRNQQELLVTMREVTEGKAFDAIVEDEFRGIHDNEARDVYSLVCAFTRARMFPRDLAVGKILGINPGELYSTFLPHLEGIVKVECIDEARDINVLSARHHVIASIVWERCVERLRRESLLLSALGHLNLSYGFDAKSFESFVRDDSLIDGLQSVEAKMRFFEIASRKDPASPYVRQHYARMLRREGNLEAALGQVEQALRMGPNVRSIWNTKGTILRDMALGCVGTPTLGRRRLAQAEEAFNTSLQLDARDGYAHQGLADLYLKWAKAVVGTSNSESGDYVAKSEEAIRRGLGAVRDRDKESLYITSAELERFLGDTPASIAELEKALDAAPGSRISIYLLGTALRKHGDLNRASLVLLEGLKTTPDDSRLARAYALTLLEQGDSYEGALAILGLATFEGLQDAEFICLYGGLLVMNGDINAANDVWRRAKEQHWSVRVQSQIGYSPRAGDETARWLRGRVSRLTAGYAFVAVSGYSDFYCSAQKYDRIRLRTDSQVSIRPGFSVRGPQVLEIRVDA